MPRRAKTPDTVNLQLHAEAVAAGRHGYVDPRTGLFVFTELGLLAQGRCCGSGCMHCPFPPDEQARAGRPE